MRLTSGNCEPEFIYLSLITIINEGKEEIIFFVVGKAWAICTTWAVGSFINEYLGPRQQQ